MPEYDVFVTARVRVEAPDDLKAEGFVLDVLDDRLAEFLDNPQVLESSYTLSSDNPRSVPVCRKTVNHRRRRG